LIYLDTSALLKLLRPEAETGALLTHLDGVRDELLTSVIATVETARALTALGLKDRAVAAVPDSSRIDCGSAAVATVALTRQILDTARTLPPPTLRSLDALHVATALSAGAALDHLIAYDRRMTDAAGAAGLRVASPS
jgi:predicted nucleic acid-binding protein